MKITIQYLLIHETTENQAYSIDFDLPDVNIPQANHDWKGLVQERFNLPNIMTMGQMKVDRSDSNHIKISATFTLNNLLNSLPKEVFLLITQGLPVKPYIHLRNQVSKEQTHRMASIEANLSGIAVFKQSPGAWVRLEDINAVVGSLKYTQSIKQLLTLVDEWIQTEDGVKKFYLWMDKFGECFASMYKQLANKPADLKQEHQALYHLITKHKAIDEIVINEKELVTIATDATIIEKYPAVANSLTTTSLFLNNKQNTSYLDWLNSKGVLYWNLSKANLTGVDLVWATLPGANLTRVDLREANLLGANLIRAVLFGADLPGATLTGADLRKVILTRANLAEANLSGVNLKRAILAGAELREANLTGANLTRAGLRETNLIKADLTGANLTRADLREANLLGANLIRAVLFGVDLTGADLTRATLAGAELREANLTRADLTRAILAGAELREAKLTEADLTKANLTGATLTGTNLNKANLTGANLTRAGLRETNLIKADLTGANLTRADLREANLLGANLIRAVLFGIDLTGADLTRATLAGAELREADLINANLTRAILAGADLRAANLTGANLNKADLTRANLTGANLTGADLAESNINGANFTNIVWSAESLSSAKTSCWKTTEADIKKAEVNVLSQIYQDSICQGNLWDIQKNPTWDKFCSFFKSIPIQTNHRQMLNNAICQKAHELMKTTDKTDPTFTVLEELINKVSRHPRRIHVSHHLK